MNPEPKTPPTTAERRQQVQQVARLKKELYPSLSDAIESFEKKYADKVDYSLVHAAILDAVAELLAFMFAAVEHISLEELSKPEARQNVAVGVEAFSYVLQKMCDHRLEQLANIGVKAGGTA